VLKVLVGLVLIETACLAWLLESGDLPYTRTGVRVDLHLEMLWRDNRPALMVFAAVAITCLLLVAQPRHR
jgi:glucose dehydrogenase